MSADNKNLWAPWRMEYIQSLAEQESDGCFLCRYWSEPDKDEQNLVVWRGATGMAVLNRFPYSNGHVMIAPARHAAELGELDTDQMIELLCITRDMQTVLKQAVHAQGFNVGMNFSRCAGAGLPDHLHLHIVPRWEGDTNFMAILGQVRVIPQALQAVYDRTKQLSAELKLPRLESPVDR